MVERSQQVFGTFLAEPGGRRWKRYVAIGDSLSEGLGDPVAGGRTRGWATLLAEHLRATEPRLAFTNLAVRGYLARDALARQLRPALDARPDLVSIVVGGNDVLLRARFEPAVFGRELDALVGPFAARGATVVMSTLPDLAACSPLVPPLRGALRRRLESANAVVRTLSELHGTVLLDAWIDPRTRHHAMWSIDRIHPSAAGHRVIAASIAELLGVPVDPATHHLEPASAPAVARRYGREAAWLLRYAFRPAAPTGGAPSAPAVTAVAG